MFPFTITASRFQIQKALFAIASHEDLMAALTRVFYECNLKPDRQTPAEIIHHPGGMLDRAMTGITWTSFPADMFSVRSLSSGNPSVTGLELQVSVKFNFLNKSDKQIQISRFSSALLRITQEKQIQLIDYDSWDDFVSKHPQFTGDCGWNSEFLFRASKKFRTKTGWGHINP
jgi:hypothetical protein